MIQKPSKKSWQQATGYKPQAYQEWWYRLTAGIDPAKDADCLTQTNLQRVYAGTWKIVPATVKAILTIMKIALRSPITDDRLQQKVVVVGRSELVGRPLAAVLDQRGAHVTLCGSQTERLDGIVAQADIVVSATGVADLIKGAWIKPGAVVIDVGSPRGDVAYDEAIKRAGFITPVPYGVGPMTVVSLLENVADILTVA
jgi:methylenetetrahydrofolate dehydrogenase (NADP+)/methenyltetrahydrofolate cyclohydrolase